MSFLLRNVGDVCIDYIEINLFNIKTSRPKPGRFNFIPPTNDEKNLHKLFSKLSGPVPGNLAIVFGDFHQSCWGNGNSIFVTIPYKC